MLKTSNFLHLLYNRSPLRIFPVGCRYLCAQPPSETPTLQPPSESDKPVVRTIKKMPASLMMLINDPRFNQKWPSPAAITELTLKCSEAGVSLLEIESYLVRESRTGKKGGNRFYSRHIYEKWTKAVAENSADSNIQLNRYFDHIETTLLKMADKVEVPMKRAEYVVCIWRLVLLLEQSILQNLQVDSFLAFCEKCRSKHNDINMLVFLTLVDIQLSQTPLEVSPEISRELTNLFQPFSSKPNLELNPSFPSSFQLCQAEKGLVHLCSGSLDDNVKSSILLSLCLLRWKKSNFSESLESLSEATNLYFSSVPEHYLKNSLNESTARLTLQLCLTWMEICRSCLAQKMSPAIDYLLYQSEFFLKSVSVIGPLPAYLILIGAKQSSNVPENLVSDLESMVPRSWRNPKFEKCFTVATMTLETKSLLVNEFIKNIFNGNIVEQKVLTSLNTAKNELKTDEIAYKMNKTEPKTELTGENFTVDLSDPTQKEIQDGRHENLENNAAMNLTQSENREIQQQMFDVQVLECVVENDIEALLDLCLEKAKCDMYPGEEATHAIIQHITKHKDINSLRLLYRGAQEGSKHCSLFYTELCNIQLRGVLDQWEAGKHIAAWISLVELYRSILSDRTEARIGLNTSESLVLRCRNICKLFIEEGIEMGDQFLHPIRSGGLQLASEYRDVFVLLAYWESLFFSHKFEQQMKAEQLMEDQEENCV
ncbi:uncharacterized protein LOC111710038 [Eurytemora carolleeae]|uniref:uncharacterized protein LOC111710038 n=1 Tax=Eurytemora carolleeae TaxID=1294199 RepID=UPI000C7857BC|nr:uncharacterized protein LOC111710038 [Eurytemora carolleeae]|eukprot:XP_023339819.1 uncharacterized protein LOC111710038 [Eurytemora affinis]